MFYLISTRGYAQKRYTKKHSDRRQSLHQTVANFCHPLSPSTLHYLAPSLSTKQLSLSFNIPVRAWRASRLVTTFSEQRFLLLERSGAECRKLLSLVLKFKRPVFFYLYDNLLFRQPAIRLKSTQRQYT